MKRTSARFVAALLTALAVPGIGLGQQTVMWRPAVSATPVLAPVVSEDGTVSEPAVYAAPPLPAVPVAAAPGSAVVAPAPYAPGPYAPAMAPMVSYVTAAPGMGVSANGCGVDGESCGIGGSGCGNSEGIPCCRDWLADRFGVCGTWGSVEFLHVWAHGRNLPPLVTTSPDTTPRSSAGVLPGATTLFGGGRIGDDRQSAGRLTAGVWLDECESTGLGVRLFGIEGANDGITRRSDPNTGLPIYGVPFFNDQLGANDALLASYPGEQAGLVSAKTSQDVLTGEILLRSLMLRGNGYRLDLIGGYHYTLVSDGVDVMVNTTIIDPAGVFPIGSQFDILDRFDARNDFHGATAGFMGELRHGCWRIHGLTKLSFGNMHQVVTINGSTLSAIAGGSTTLDPTSGLFAQPSNGGVHARDVTTYIPEVALNFGYQINPHTEITFGYSFIYWANVVQAGDHIDTVVDLSQAGGGPPASRPAFTFHDTDFWVQGISIGMNWNY